MLGKRIGDGSMAVVYLKDKVVEKHYLDINNPIAKIAFKDEVNSLKKLQGCPWIVQYLGHCSELGMISMEALEGDVKYLLKQKEQYPLESWSWQFTTDLLHAEQAMFEAKVFHGDLNMNNILYYIKADKTLGFKVCDFSHSTLMNESLKVVDPFPLLGAPEFLREGEDGFNLNKVTIWTIGNLIFYLYENTFPVHFLWKRSKYFDSYCAYMSVSYHRLTGNFVTDPDAFRQDDLKGLIIEMDEILPSDKETITKELLSQILVIDSEERWTPGQALKFLRIKGHL